MMFVNFEQNFAGVSRPCSASRVACTRSFRAVSAYKSANSKTSRGFGGSSGGYRPSAFSYVNRHRTGLTGSQEFFDDMCSLFNFLIIRPIKFVYHYFFVVPVTTVFNFIKRAALYYSLKQQVVTVEKQEEIVVNSSSNEPSSAPATA